MKIEYNGTVHEAVVDDNGCVVGKDEKLFFGHSVEEIIQGTLIADVIVEDDESIPVVDDGLPTTSS
jgi:hypothetical protein